MRTFLVAMAVAGCGGQSANLAPEASVVIVDEGLGDYLIDGRASADPEGEPLIWMWAVDYASDGRDAPELEPVEDGVVRLSTGGEGVWVVGLVVSDGELDSDPTSVVISTSEADISLIADAGPDRSAPLGQTVYIDGSASFDPAGGDLTYAWTVASSPALSAIQAGVLSGQESAVLAFQPDVEGSYRLGLQVRQGPASSEVDEVVLTVQPNANAAPTAVALAPARADQCTPVPLSCDASTDPDGDLLVPFWQLQRVPADFIPSGTPFEDANAMQTTAVLDQLGEYTFSCSVHDGVVWSRPDEVDVTVVPRAGNAVPEVDAGLDQVLNIGTVTCTCPDSSKPWSSACSCPPCTPRAASLTVSVSDIDDSIHDYEWSAITGRARFEGGGTQASAQLAMPSILPKEPGLHFDEALIEVEVTDCVGASATDRLVVRTTCEAVYP